MKNVQNQYFKILNDLRNKKEEVADLDVDNLDSIINQTNALFTNITNSIELKLDARISAETVNISSIDFEKKLRNRKISTELFIKHLNKNFRNTDNSTIQTKRRQKINIFLEKINKNFYGIRFKEIYALAFDKKTKKKKEAAKKDEESTKSTEIKFKQTETEDFTQKIDKLVCHIGNSRIEYYRVVLNPTSFTETIENIFYLSFAVKCNKLKLIFDKNVFYVTGEKNNNKVCIKEHEQCHFTSTINYEEYKKLVQNLEIKEAFLNLK